MFGEYRRCLLCDAAIKKPFWLCSSCEEAAGVAGKNISEWPAWLVAIRNEERAVRRHSAREIVGPLGVETEWSLVNQDGYIEPLAGTPRRLTDADLLQYAPYADEAANREYRLANGIPERDG